jgi:N-acetylneuraminate synthase
LKPFIIADIGSNFRNSLELAFKQIEAAKECGCDAAKFQLYTHEELYGLPGKLEYELPKEWLQPLALHCEKTGIDFMCSAFSPMGVAHVDPFVKRHKLASSEFLHCEIIEAIKKTGKPWIASTGGAHAREVGRLIDLYRPTAILECVAQYPAKSNDYNLKCLQRWGDETGISDHTPNDSVALAAIGFGATIFEKHFDGADQGLVPPGPATPDTPVSYSYFDMMNYVTKIKQAFSAIGDGIKQPRNQPEMALRWRRRLIVTKDLPVGAKLKSHENYGIYRSLKDDTRGAAPELLPKFDGAILKVEKKAGDSLWINDIE